GGTRRPPRSRPAARRRPRPRSAWPGSRDQGPAPTRGARPTERTPPTDAHRLGVERDPRARRAQAEAAAGAQPAREAPAEAAAERPQGARVAAGPEGADWGAAADRAAADSAADRRHQTAEAARPR